MEAPAMHAQVADNCAAATCKSVSSWCDPQQLFCTCILQLKCTRILHLQVPKATPDEPEPEQEQERAAEGGAGDETQQAHGDGVAGAEQHTSAVSLEAPPAGSQPSAAASAMAATPEETAEERDRKAAEAERQNIIDNLGPAMHALYAALLGALGGPEGDLVAMSFERGDAACVW